jgi:Na+/H+-dicarboxylate symporter
MVFYLTLSFKGEGGIPGVRLINNLLVVTSEGA